MGGTDELEMDQDQDMIQDPAQADNHSADLMRRELQAVITSPDFARAPIMKRLISFLVDETAAGRGDQLKAYSVAVDGLGRAPDYDARADSYPRVQVGRLRRMLDSHYGTTRPVSGLRLAIPSGRYRVALQPDVAVGMDDIPPSAETAPIQPLAFALNVIVLLAVLAVVAFATVRLLPMRLTSPHASHARPTLQLVSGSMSGGGNLARLVHATLLNGLGRSPVFDLGASNHPSDSPPQGPSIRYRLTADLVEGDHPRLFLRLARQAPDRLIWSGDISLSGTQLGDSQALDRVVAPAIATIGRVTGLVATHELQENGGDQAAGYSCMLLYHRYRKDRIVSEREHVRACIDRSLKIDPGDAGLQAAAAQLTIDQMVSSETPPRDRPALLLTASRHAQISASIDPLEPWANATRARIAVLRKACPQAISYSIRASQLQPYDPALLGDVGVYLLDCGDPRAEATIRRAIALDDEPDGRFYAPLLLLAIGRDDQQLAREALSHMAPPIIGRQGRFYLISAAGYAMIGDLPRARAAWTQLGANNALIAHDPHGYFERWGFSAELRAKAMAHLRRAKLVGG